MFSVALNGTGVANTSWGVGIGGIRGRRIAGQTREKDLTKFAQWFRAFIKLLWYTLVRFKEVEDGPGNSLHMGELHAHQLPIEVGY